MQIVKQINKNELDTRKRKNQLGQLISKWIKKKEMQWDQGCSQVEGVREDRSQQYLLGRRPPVWFPPMDNLRNLEDLSRTEFVWLKLQLATSYNCYS